MELFTEQSIGIIQTNLRVITYTTLARHTSAYQWLLSAVQISGIRQETGTCQYRIHVTVYGKKAESESKTSRFNALSENFESGKKNRNIQPETSRRVDESFATF